MIRAHVNEFIMLHNSSATYSVKKQNIAFRSLVSFRDTKGKIYENDLQLIYNDDEKALEH